MKELNEALLPSSLLVSSRGLASLCDSRSHPLCSSANDLPLNLLESHRSGEAIYVCSDALTRFSDLFLPQLNCPFVLVSGDSDLRLDEEFFCKPPIRRLLGSSLLVRWFAQNLCWMQDPRLHRLPIGLDYHTMWEKPGAWGITAQTALAQEQQLISVFSLSPSFSQRHLTCYCNFQFSLDRGNRNRAQAELSKEACIFEINPVPRLSTWQRQAQCMFVASPEGVGPDCHRTWEAIALGCVPIVQRSTHSAIFEDLPVLLVDEWAEVTPPFLKAAAEKFSAFKYNYNKIFLDHWRSQFREPPRMGRLPPLSMNEFKFLIASRTY